MCNSKRVEINQLNRNFKDTSSGDFATSIYANFLTVYSLPGKPAVLMPNAGVPSFEGTFLLGCFSKNIYLWHLDHSPLIRDQGNFYNRW